jgi:SAPK-interacting protein 1 (Sin1), middle CRIM domain
LDEGISGEDDPKWATRLSAVGWIMRIAEEDGEVDDDFPRKLLFALPAYLFMLGHASLWSDGKIAKFNADAYAVLEPQRKVRQAFRSPDCAKAAVSPTKWNTREQDSTSSVANYGCKRKETGKELNPNTQPTAARYWWARKRRIQLYFGFGAFVYVPRAIFESWPPNIPQG